MGRSDGGPGTTWAAVVSVDSATPRGRRVVQRFVALTGEHGGTVRETDSRLVATFPALGAALETATGLVLGADGGHLSCGVLRLDGSTVPELDAVVPVAAELCRAAGPGRIVVAAARELPDGAGDRESEDSDEIVGRAAELRALNEALSRAESGHAQVVTIAGSLGSGRSTLLRHLTAVARSRGAAVLAVTGVESELGGRWTSLATATLTDPHTERAHRFATDLPALSDATAAAQRTAAHELLARVAALTDDDPLLVTVDDLDRVDEASRDALRFVAHRLGAERCLVVATVSDPPPQQLSSEVLRLRDLPDAALAAIIERDGPIDATVLRRCIELAAGNPLAAREVSRSLSPRQRSGLDPLPAVPEPAAAVLAGFRELLGRASDAARRAAVVAAADDTGDSGVIRTALAELGEDPAGLEEGEEAGLLRLDGTLVRFAHPMLRSVAYHQVAARSRRAAHRALAGALSRPQQAAARAFQLAAAAVGPSEPAAAALALVSESEVRRGDPRAAARALARAAQLTADGTVRDDRYVRAAVLYLRAGARSAAESMLGEAGSPAASPDALVATCLTELARVGPTRARTHLDHRLDRGEVRDELRPAAVALRAHLSALGGDPPEASATAVGLAVAARALAGAEPAARLLDTAGRADGALGALEASVVAAALAEGGWVAEAARIVDDLDASASAIDPGAVQATAGLLALESGRPLAALERLGDGDPGPGDTCANECARLLALTRARLHAGRLGDAEQSLRQATTIVDRLGLALHEGEVDRLGGLVLHAQGRAEGLDLLERARHKRPDRALGDHVLAVLERGGRPPAGCEPGLRLLAGSPDPRVSLGARRALAALTNDTRALGDLARECQEAGLVLESVLTRGARVAAALRAGVASAPLKQDVAELGRRYGVTCPGARYWESAITPDPVRERLSKAEHRVAVAVGAGASNKVAAEDLFVSVKTVDYHLQNIYRKLGIRSRTELAVLMAGTRGTEEDGR